MKLIKSSKGIPLPMIYFVENELEINKLPIGIPFIRGNNNEYEEIVQTLEFEILYKSALKTGLEFDWFKILEENGYENLIYDDIAFSEKFMIDELNLLEDSSSVEEFDEKTKISTKSISIKNLVNNVYPSYIVDIEVLKNLEIIPTFLVDIEKAIEINIHNGYKFNPFSYNKKLGLPIGELEVSTTKKNLIIIDVSASIPKAIAKTILRLAKTMSTQFYADLIITGRISTLYEYDDIDTLDAKVLYEDHSRGNEQSDFKAILESEYRSYNTVICFGDNHSPGYNWKYKDSTITIEKGKELCKFEVENIISFHTTSDTDLAGYAEWFDCNEVTHIEEWVTYFNK